VTQNRQEGNDVGHVSRSGDLLHMEVSRSRVFQTGLQTSGDVMIGGARDTIVKVA
jgi:hypothetical protein